MYHSKRFNPILRKLLRVDHPVPQRTDAELNAEIQRNYRWNFSVNLLDISSFWFALSFISSATIVPLYISKLTDSTFAIGLAAVIAQSSWFLPQIFTANFVERLPRKKPVIVNLGFFLERVPMWLLVLSALLAVRSPTLALIIFLGGYAWHGFGAGIVATSWQELIARCFPVERRGRFLGTSFFFGATAGALAAGLSARLLENYPFPTNFVYGFLLAAAFITFSWFFLAQTREPVPSERPPRRATRQFWADLPDLLRKDINFRRYLVARFLFAFSAMSVGFITVAAVRRWQVADSVVAVYTATWLFGQMGGNLLFGFLSDRYGHKLTLELGTIAGFSAFSLAWLAPESQWYFLVFFLMGMMDSAVILSGILVLMEFSSADNRPTYAGITHTGVGVVNIAGPLIGAGLAAVGFNWLFAASTALALSAFAALHWWVKEPRNQPNLDREI